jgi:uncharacterized membrane protein
MKNAYEKVKVFLKDPDFFYQLFAGSLMLLLGMVTSVLGNHHATTHMGASVPDIFIWGISSQNMVSYYVGTAITFLIVLGCFIIWKPRTAPFLLFALGMFYLIRSGFIILNTPGFPEGIVGMNTASPFIKEYFFGGDLFFSGHAGAPFLVALALWNYHKIARTVFLAVSTLRPYYPGGSLNVLT